MKLYSTPYFMQTGADRAGELLVADVLNQVQMQNPAENYFVKSSVFLPRGALLKLSQGTKRSPVDLIKSLGYALAHPGGVTDMMRDPQVATRIAEKAQDAGGYAEIDIMRRRAMNFIPPERVATCRIGKEGMSWRGYALPQQELDAIVEGFLRAPE